MIMTFQHFVHSNLLWNDGIFRTMNQESLPFFRVIEAAAKLKLFRKLTIQESTETFQQPLIPRLAAAIASVIREGGRLEEVTILNFQISAQAMAVLATGLATAGQTDGLNELSFSCCQFIGRDESGGLMGAPEYLAAGLASNATLKTLRLLDAQLNDASLASIVGALASHPTLETLILHGCEYGRSRIESIHRWLRMDSCRLRDLRMYGCFDRDESYDQSETDDQSEGNLDLVQLFVQDLPKNNSMESLSISCRPHIMINESDISLLLGSLGKLPNLRSLDVSGNEIADIASLMENLVCTMPAHRLRCLDLSDNPCTLHLYARVMQQHKDGDDSMEKSILQLLEAFPEWGFLGEDLSGWLDLVSYGPVWCCNLIATGALGFYNVV